MQTRTKKSISADTLRKAIAKSQTKLDALSDEDRRNIDRTMAVEFDEHFEFQQMQAMAHAVGRLQTDAALMIYEALGEVGSEANGGWSANTSTATKVIVTQVMAELLALRIQKRL